MHVDQNIPLLPYEKEWREHRKLSYIALGHSAVKKYHGVQSDIAALMNKDFLEGPDDFFSHVRLTSRTILPTVTYGVSVDAADNEYINRAEDYGTDLEYFYVTSCPSLSGSRRDHLLELGRPGERHG
ncbi:hypothetical protein A0H81_05740 [Grifola frondosa]|uniref:Uncharacterized protein n=1 Tax=Grifola frondosa TaxID=5627 RepID=A0A1C7MCS9_GRIFR|nr:hypothetical protein A0H81_05740 [Grifola frondosa]